MRLIPDQENLKRLKEVANGSLTESFSVKDFPSYADDEDADFWLKDLANERYRKMLDHRYYHMGFLDVDKPYRDENLEWVVNVFATDLLLECIKGMEQGLVWNCEEKRVDYDLTEAMLLDGINRGYLTQWYIDMALKNKAPELAAARAKLVQWKLSAHLEGDRWVQ